MASERALVALHMRRGGAKYLEIGHHLHVSDCRARQLVMRALAEEAHRQGFRSPTGAELESIKFRRVRRGAH
jgi:hypothetical protein